MNNAYSSLWIQVKILIQVACDMGTSEIEIMHANGAMVNDVLPIPWYKWNYEEQICIYTRMY